MIPDRPTPEEVDTIRSAFPAGTAVELVAVKDPYRTLPPGVKGMVNAVDDIGTLHVEWDEKGSFGIVPGVDDVMRVKDGIRLSEIVATLAERGSGEPV